MRLTSRLARQSLSPNFSSLTETVSFSLTMGSTPQSMSSAKVLRALRKRWRARRSSRVSSTCEVGKS